MITDVVLDYDFDNFSYNSETGILHYWSEDLPEDVQVIVVKGWISPGVDTPQTKFRRVPGEAFVFELVK